MTTRSPRHAAAPPHDLVVVRDAGVREAVGQEEAAPHRLGRELLDDLLAAPPPAALEVGRAARLDAGHGASRGLPRLGGGALVAATSDLDWS